MHQTDRVKLIPYVDYLEKELPFSSEYEKKMDWRIYELERSRRLEVERWVESLINATLDISKMLLAITGEEVPETSREVLFKMGTRIYDTEEEAEAFSELVKIKNTLAHRYLDLRWNDIKRFLQIVPELYPGFLEFVKKKIEEE